MSEPNLNGLLVIIRSPAREIERRQAIRDTWGADLKSLGATVLFSVENRYASEMHLKDDVLTIPGPDAHWNLTNRMSWTFRWILQQEGWTHFLTMDDDCYLCARRLSDCQVDWRPAMCYGHKNTSWYASGGPGVILSRSACEKLNYHIGRDDCVIGALLTCLGEKITHTNTKFQPWREGQWVRRENDTVIQHYVRSPDEIRQLHREVRSWK